MMWGISFILLGVIAILLLLVLELSERLRRERKRTRREISMRVATEIELCEMIEELGERFRRNRQRMSEADFMFRKTTDDGHGPN